MRTVAFIALLGACGSSTSSTPTTPKEEPAQAVLPDVPFEQLDHEQRSVFMEQKVMPAMEPLFVNHDAKRFADFGCVTCHGKRALDGHYEMPNAELPKLDFNNLSKWKQADIDWMNKVKPAMATLLSKPVWTPQNPTAFGCEGCHPTE